MIVVVGSCNVDMAVYTPRAPRAGETVLGSRLAVGPGGKGANQATAARRCGCETVFVAKTGRDFFADIIREHFASEGISCEFVKACGEATGTATIIVGETEDPLSGEKAGENRIVVVAGANAQLSPKDVLEAEERIKACSAVLCQLEAGPEATIQTLLLAKKYGKISILNPAPPRDIPKSCFSGLYCVTPNETEAQWFTGIEIKTDADAFAAGRRFLGFGVKNAVITLGARGAALVNDKTELIIPAADLKPVDTTGAGDCFNGALAAALSEGMEITDALRFACCAASISVTRPGASGSMPQRSEIDGIFKKTS